MYKTYTSCSILFPYDHCHYSVPHEWFINSLHLAKLPEDLIRAIEYLISQWSTVVKGIFQSDSLSVLLFTLWVNPLLFSLHKFK